MSAAATRSAWNIANPSRGKLSWCVSRTLADGSIEWMRNSTGRVLRFRSQARAIAAVEAANAQAQATAPASARARVPA